MRPEELSQNLKRMLKETQDGKLQWKVAVQTTEGNEEKYTIEEDGISWSVDECYVSFVCQYQGKEFCLITYEMIRQSGDKTRTVNYLFLPPLGVRLFSLHTLLPHSVEADSVLVSQVHMLWELLMKMRQQNPQSVEFTLTEAEVHIEEDVMAE